MNIDAQALFDLFAELYPRELRHVLAELRARQAEQRLAELENIEDKHAD
jgi:hypothetical protein